MSIPWSNKFGAGGDEAVRSSLAFLNLISNKVVSTDCGRGKVL